MKKLTTLFLSFILLLATVFTLAPSLFAAGPTGNVSIFVKVYSHNGTSVDVENFEIVDQGYGSKFTFGAAGLASLKGKDTGFILNNGVIIDNPSHQFIVGGSTTVYAFLRNNAQVIAVFVDTNGQVLDVQYSANPVDPELSISKPGYTLVGYSPAIAPISQDTIFVAQYDRDNDTEINVVVNGGTKDLATVYYNDIVTLTPSANESDFAYWADADGQIISTDSNFQFTALEDIEITAVFENGFSAGFGVYLQDVTGINQGKQSFLGYINNPNPSNYEVIEYGLLVSNDSKVLFYGDTNVTSIPSTILAPTNEFLRSFNEGVYSSFRGYVIYKDGLTQKIAYSDNNYSLGLTVIDQVGFNTEEEFGSTGTNYQLPQYQTYGPTGKQWSINYGLFSTTGPVEGTRSAQFRTYASSGGYGSLISEYTQSANKMSFKASSELDALNIEVSISTDKSTWTDAQTFNLSSSYSSYEYTIPTNDPVYFKFTVVGTKDGSTRRVYVDEVSFIGLGDEFDQMYSVNFFDMNDEFITRQSIFKNQFSSSHYLSIPGYTFNYWQDENDIEFDFNTPINEHINLYPNLTINNYSVSFNTNGGSSIETLSNQPYQSEILEPASPTKEGYTFEGWYTNSGLTNPVVWPYLVPAYSSTLYAAWTVNQYTIVTNGNGGSDIADITQNYGTDVLEPEADPSRSGYVFIGWFTDALQTTPVSWPIVMPVNGTTIYAGWAEEQESWSVTFDANGGTPAPTSPISVGNGLKVTEPATMTKGELIFGGWFTDEGTWSDQWDFDNDTVTIDIILYAKWSALSQEYTFTVPTGTTVGSNTTNTDFTSRFSNVPSGMTIYGAKVALNTAGQFRLYQTVSDGYLRIQYASGTIVSIKITFGGTVAKTTVGTAIGTGVNPITTIISDFTPTASSTTDWISVNNGVVYIDNTHASNQQLYITKIVVTYLPE